MLNELETLSQNIGRLIALNQRHHTERLALEEQVAQLRAQAEAVRVELEQLCNERNGLVAERDALSAKIDDAKVKLNAILEKLPRTRQAADGDSQLDLLDGGEAADSGGDDAASHGEYA
ncbi:MAG: ATPase [Burkholderia sp.]